MSRGLQIASDDLSVISMFEKDKIRGGLYEEQNKIIHYICCTLWHGDCHWILGDGSDKKLYG